MINKKWFFTLRYVRTLFDNQTQCFIFTICSSSDSRQFTNNGVIKIPTVQQVTLQTNW